ncbi:hypothetical protein CDAR_192321 [Caerostris darwini]|uniref:Uncharacterized protein n=1 Tax=Caerostris darwini TaxID=1538125 RepID=A0AAV4X0S4_9ARAC|nr:hypothetical protein CDAR_192321 [Caerostris darwini]
MPFNSSNGSFNFNCFPVNGFEKIIGSYEIAAVVTANSLQTLQTKMGPLPILILLISLWDNLLRTNLLDCLYSEHGANLRFCQTLNLMLTNVAYVFNFMIRQRTDEKYIKKYSLETLISNFLSTNEANLSPMQ